jgi:fructosamine-3-kinase
MMRQEPQVHALVLERTNVPVPRIIAFDESREAIDRRYLLMERLPGVPLSHAGCADLASVLRTLGRHMAQVHAITAERYGYLGAHHPMEPQSTWGAAFHLMWNKLIDDVVSVGHYNADEEAAMRRLLDDNMAFFERSVPSSLLHMDIWAENILVGDAGDVTGIVDWDRALWGDTEIEFAVLDYCGISKPPFWEGYGKPPDMSHEARVRQAFYLLYELQKYIVIQQGRDNDADSARRYKRQTMNIVGKQLLPLLSCKGASL